MEAIGTFISTVGFPIGAYILLFLYTAKLNEQHKEEIVALRQSLDANTQALIKLEAHFGGVGDDAEI